MREDELLYAKKHSLRTTDGDILAFAIKFDKRKLFKYLLKERRELLQQKHLMVAVRVNVPRATMVRCLLRLGLDVNFEGGYLSEAASVRSMENAHYVEPVVVSALLELGADVNEVDDNGMTPLHHCLKMNHRFDKLSKMLSVLLEHGVNPDARDNEGKTALETYLKFLVKPVPEVLGVLKLFFKHGADDSIVSVKRILLSYGWPKTEFYFVPDVPQDPMKGKPDPSKVPGRMVANEGGEHYKAAAPMLESVTRWRQTKTFAEVCTVFFDVKQLGPREKPAKRTRTCRGSFLEVNVDILRCVLAFL